MKNTTIYPARFYKHTKNYLFFTKLCLILPAFCCLSGCKQSQSTQGREYPNTSDGKKELAQHRDDNQLVQKGAQNSPPAILATEIKSVDEILLLDDQQLVAFFETLNNEDPQRSCDLILKLPLSTQKKVLPGSVAKLALIDPVAALEIVDSLQAGALRKDCIWFLGRVLSADDLITLGGRLGELYPEDQIALVNASDAAGEREIRLIIQALESNNVGGEAMILAKSKLAYVLGESDPSDFDPDIVSEMGGREKKAYVNGILRKDPHQALSAALRIAENDPQFLSSVGSQIVVALLQEGEPEETISQILKMDLDATSHKLLVSSAFGSWMDEEPESASQFVLQMPNGSGRQSAIEAIVDYCNRVGDKSSATRWNEYLVD